MQHLFPNLPVHFICHAIICSNLCVSKHYVTGLSVASSVLCLRRRLALGHSQTRSSCWQIVSLLRAQMCSSRPDGLDVVWNICVVSTPEEDRQERDRGQGNRQGRGWWDPRVFPPLMLPSRRARDGVRQRQCVSRCVAEKQHDSDKLRGVISLVREL